MKNTKSQSNDDDLSLLMRATIGATVVSLVTSFSTHHISAQAAHSATDHVVSPTEVSRLFEREREVLHAHSNLSRSRYATVSGNNS